MLKSSGATFALIVAGNCQVVEPRLVTASLSRSLVPTPFVRKAVAKTDDHFCDDVTGGTQLN